MLRPDPGPDHDSAAILLIDEDPLTLTALAAATTLQMPGCQVFQARDEAAARQAAGGRALDLIVCDAELGGEGQGVALCQQLREAPGLADTPVIFLTRRQNIDVRRTADGAYFVRKPVEPRLLLELVRTALWMPHLTHAHLRRRDAQSHAAHAPAAPRAKALPAAGFTAAWHAAAPLGHAPHA